MNFDGKWPEMPLHARRAAAILAAQMRAPVKTSAAAPERSLDQRMDALKRANDIRTARAKLKKDLKAGKANIHALLLDPPEYVHDRQGLRHAPRGPQVRPGEDEPDPQPVPDLAVEDDRRALRAPARRAGLAAPPLATAAARPVSIPVAAWPRSSSSPARRGVGKGTLIAELLRARAGARALGLGDDPRAPRRARSDGRDYHFLSPEEFDGGSRPDDFLEFATYSGNRYGTLRSEVERRLDEGALGGARDRGPGGPPGARRDAASRSRSSSRRPTRPRCASGSRGGAPTRRRRSTRGSRPPSWSWPRRREFDHVVVNDELERAAGELEGIVRAELGLPLDSAAE